MTPGRLLRSLGFVVAIYACGTFLTRVDAGAAPSGRLLFVLFGANGRIGVDCTGNRPAMPCSQGAPREARASIEILDVMTEPPSRRATLDLGVAVPTSLAVAPDGSRVFVVDSLTGSVLTVATASGTVTAATRIPDGPVDCALSRDGTALYVTTAKPAVVTVAAATGTIVSMTAPGQSYAERLSGIAVDPAPGSARLAVAATSSGPAVYFLTAEGAAVTIERRVAAAAACTQPACSAGDDAAFTSDGRVLLANLACGELYAFAAADGARIGGGRFGTNACLATNPHNSLSFNALSRRAQIVWRGYSMGIAPGMPAVDLADLSATLLTDRLRAPEAAAVTRDGRWLFIVSRTTARGVPGYQIKGPPVFLLETFDVAAGAFSRAAHTFDTPIEGRAAIDAHIVETSGGLAAVAGALLPVGSGARGGMLGPVSLVLFGGALLLLDRRRGQPRL